MTATVIASKKSTKTMTDFTASGTGYRALTTAEKSKKLLCSVCNTSFAKIANEANVKFCSTICLDGTGEPLTDQESAINDNGETEAPAPNRYAIILRLRGMSKQTIAVAKTDKEAYKLLTQAAAKYRNEGKRIAGSWDTGYVIVNPDTQVAIGSLHIGDIENGDLALTVEPKSDRSAISPTRLFLTAKVAVKANLDKAFETYISDPTTENADKVTALMQNFKNLLKDGEEAFKMPIVP